MTTTAHTRDLAVIQLTLHHELTRIVRKEYLEAFNLREAIRELYRRTKRKA